MPKSQDVPLELREFNKIFESISYRWNYSEVFEDFLDMMINAFSFNHKIDLERLQKKYKLEERHKFGQLIYEIIKVMDKMITTDKDWYDPFGEFYMALVSSGKASSLGQFFTPAPVVTMMCQILDTQSGETVNDPACGSGRFSLASHVISPGQFHVNQDLDYICCRMAALNFMLHGVNGIVINMNSLANSEDHFYQAFRVNRRLGFTRVPEIEYTNDIHYVKKFVSIMTNEEIVEQAVKKELEFIENQKPTYVVDGTIINKKSGQTELF